jgi:hypothetical protein
MQTMHKGLPWGLNLWGFTDFNGTQGTRDDHFELTQFFTEYRLRKPLPKLYKVEGLGVELEYNEASGADNGLLRVGLTFQARCVDPLRDRLAAVAGATVRDRWLWSITQHDSLLCAWRATHPRWFQRFQPQQAWTQPLGGRIAAGMSHSWSALVDFGGALQWLPIRQPVSGWIRHRPRTQYQALTTGTAMRALQPNELRLASCS